MKLLVKLGGTLLDEDATRVSLACQIAALARNATVTVVHGGGRQMTRFLEEHGVKSQFVNGLRVTTPAVLDAVVKVVAGSVNRQFVAALNHAGAQAVGISGIDGGLVEAEPMDAALGSVGRVTGGDGRVLDALAAGGFLPVVACVAGDRQGRIYNVNADQMAVACAAAFGAEQLIFLTDVPGVLDGQKRLLPRLTSSGAQKLIAEGAATGGMQAKLTAAASALERGVGLVRICAGAEDRVLDKIMAGEEPGTGFLREEAFAK